MKNIPPALHESCALIGDAPVPCFLLDRKGLILFANAAASTLAGQPALSPAGRNVADFLTPHDLLLARLRSRRKDLPGEELRMTISLPTEREIPVAVMIQRLKPSPRRVLFALWMRNESNLHELRGRLERSENISAMAIVAGKVAHEIRSPLNSIFLNNDLLQERIEKMRGPQREKLRRYVVILQEEVERLDEVVRSYLSLARLAGGDRQATVVETFLAGFIKDVSDEYGLHRISIATAFRARPNPLMINQRQFRRVMLNLFSNSRDAMKNGGVITLSTEDSPDGFRFTVSDNGDGIPPDALSLLATPFTSHKANGSGLGLYLVREIIEHHGGRLDIQSLHGEGTSVIITLPYPQAEATVAR